MPDALTGSLHRIRERPAAFRVEAAQRPLRKPPPEAGAGNQELLQIFDLGRGELGGDWPWGSEPVPDQV